MSKRLPFFSKSYRRLLQMKGETKCNEQHFFYLISKQEQQKHCFFHFIPIKCTIFLKRLVKYKQTNKQTNKLLYNEKHFNNTYPCILFTM